MKCTEIVLTSTEAIDLSEVEAVTGDIKSYTGMEPVQRPNRKLASSCSGFTLVDIGSKVTSNLKFAASHVLANDGKIIFPPYFADGVGVFDPADNSFELVDISSAITGTYKFAAAALANNGKVIFAPFGADGVGVFDPSDNSFELVVIGSKDFDGAVLADNGKVIFSPRNADGVGVFDPNDNSFEYVDISSTISIDHKFAANGAVLVTNGKVVFTPSNADGVGVFDPNNNSFELVDISSVISIDWKFSRGAVLATNGKVIFPPNNADGVGVFDPNDNSFELVDISSAISSDRKFDGAVLANNGKIIFPPDFADGVGVFDPVDNSFALVDVSSAISIDHKFDGGVLANNGKVIFSPDWRDVGIFDPTDNSFELVDISSAISSNRNFMSAVLANDGKVILTPGNADSVGVFDPSCDASFPPMNGSPGNCTGSLPSGSSCQPTCTSGYTVSGISSCYAGALTAATCNPQGSCEVCHLHHYHKNVSNPEIWGDNVAFCREYKYESCCAGDTVKSIYSNSKLYGDYNLEACGLSSACKQYFIEESCFYECDKNLGKWRRYGQTDGDCTNNGWEIKDAPVKASYWDSWYEACKDDYFAWGSGGTYWDIPTYTTDAYKGIGATKTNTAYTSCTKFSDSYMNGRQVAEIMWGGAFTYETDESKAYVMTFTEGQSNPNNAVFTDKPYPRECAGHEVDISTAICDPAPCNASIPPENGRAGNCTAAIPSGSVCQPTCDEGYIVSGPSSCSFGTLKSATCRKLSCCEKKLQRFGFGVRHTYEEL